MKRILLQGVRLLVTRMPRKFLRLKYLVLILTCLLCALLFRLLFPSSTGTKWKMSTMLLGDGQLPAVTQSDVDNIASHLKVHVDVVDNFVSGEKMGQRGVYLMRITFSNTGARPIRASAWEIYFDVFRLVEPNSYPYKNGFYFNKCGMKIFHMGGYLYKIQPVQRFFKEILPDSSCAFELEVAAFQVSRTDNFPNWFVAGNNIVPKIIDSTKGEHLNYVGHYNEEWQYKRRVDDAFTPLTPAQRYKLFEKTKNVELKELPVIPTPLKVERGDQKVTFSSSTWVIVEYEPFKEEVKYLGATLKTQVVSSNTAQKQAITFTKTSVITELGSKMEDHPEGYSLKIADKGISIQANQPQGAFYALQTLLSLLYNYGGLSKASLPVVTITDAPKYTYRGLHVDLARNFISKAELKKMMNVMAMYKMNKFHLHLSDDEGWRLQIPGIPELTSIGSHRCYDPDGEQCLPPMIGSGPFDNSSGSGFLSTKDYQEILHHAVSLHIDVIPEFDMPGHSQAALKSIHAKSQQELRKMMKAQIYSIKDKQDSSLYKSGQQFTDNVINPCMESTYVFTQKIIDEIQNLHKDIQPLKFYHFGGDEVAKNAWSGSPACADFMRNHEDMSSEHDLMKYFVHNITQYCANQGISVGAWEDGLLEKTNGIDLLTEHFVPFPRDHFKNKDLYVFVWKRTVERRSPHRIRLFANRGYKVIIAYGSMFYFDHAYEPDPEERGMYWAVRSISTYDAWGFDLNQMWADKDLDCPKSVKDITDCTMLKQPENIQGIQAELWTELIRNNNQVEYMLFPRLLAVAERAWQKASWEENNSGDGTAMKNSDWIKFTNIMGQYELKKLDSLGIMYRVPPPGAVVENGILKANVEFPGLITEYFSTEKRAWIAFTTLPVSQDTLIRTRTPDRKRFSRVIQVPF